MDKEIPAKFGSGLELSVNGTAFAFEDAHRSRYSITWSGVGLAWNVGDTVAAVLSAPPSSDSQGWSGHRVWSGELSTHRSPSILNGCWPPKCANYLTPDTFTHDGKTYSVEMVVLSTQKHLYFRLNDTMQGVRGATLVIDETHASFSHPVTVGASFAFYEVGKRQSWYHTHLDWPHFGTVQMSLWITQEQGPDTVDPTIAAPADVTAWSADGQPVAVALGTATAADDTDPDPTVTNDAPEVFPVGETVVTWTATDDAGNSATARQTVTVTERDASNRPPTADAGGPQTVTEGGTVSLNGTGSSDPDGDPLAYSWALTGGPAVVLAGSDTATPSFTAPDVANDTQVVFTLTVDDGRRGGSDADTVTVTVRDSPNSPPTADADGPPTVREFGTAYLVGAATDADPEDTLTYMWAHNDTTLKDYRDINTRELPDPCYGGPCWRSYAIHIHSPDSLNASFVAPYITKDTPVLFTLTVSDGEAHVTDTVLVTLLNNSPPTADAGGPQAVTEGGAVSLNGTGSSDPDGDPLTYSWALTGGPAVSLAGSDTATPSFTAPNVGNTTQVVFTLTVRDGRGDSDTDTVTVTVRDSPNRPPAVSARPADLVLPNQAATSQVSLSGVFDDPDGDPLTVTASSSNDAVAAVSVGGSTLTVSARSAGAATVTVAATDAANATARASFAVTVKASPSVASFLPDVAGLGIGEARSVALSGVFADPDGDPLTVTASSSDDAVATASVAADGGSVVVRGVSEGSADITVTAQDPDGNSVGDPFAVTVTAPTPSTLQGSTEDQGLQSVLTAHVIDATTTDRFNITSAGVIAKSADYPKLDGPTGIAVHQINSRHYALVASEPDDTVQIIDITDPAAHSLVASVSDGSAYPGLDGATDVVTHQANSRHYALVASERDSAVQVIDITDPAAPLPVTALFDYAGDDARFDPEAHYPGLDNAMRIAVHQIGPKYYAVVAAHGGDAVQIIDITDPAAPLPVTALFDYAGDDASFDPAVHYPKLDGPWDVDTIAIGSSHYALVASYLDDAVQIINITDPAAPSPAGIMANGTDYPKLEKPYSVAARQIGSGYYALIASHLDDAVQIVDITDPASPAPVSLVTDYVGDSADFDDEVHYLELLGPRHITTHQIGLNHYALVASYHDNGVQIVNITDPASPTPAAAASHGSAYPRLAGAMYITTAEIGSNHYALVASYLSRGIQMISLHAPASDANSRPSGADKSVTMPQGSTYTFAVGDFGFADPDAGDSLAKVRITMLESAGSLKLDGTDVTLNQEIPASQIGRLVFEPAPGSSGSPYAAFGFKVSDGLAYSASSYTFTISITITPTQTNRPAVLLSEDSLPLDEQRPNQAPVVSAPLGAIDMAAGERPRTVSLLGVFNDADANDRLRVTASSSNETVAAVSVSADYSQLVVTAKSRGTADITVTADDGRGATVDATFAVSVTDPPPTDVTESGPRDVVAFYDTNQDGAIDHEEWRVVVGDYEGGKITNAELLALIRARA